MINININKIKYNYKYKIIRILNINIILIRNGDRFKIERLGDIIRYNNIRFSIW